MAFSFAGALSGMDKVQARRDQEEELAQAREQSLFQIYLNKLEKQTAYRSSDAYLEAAQASLDLQKMVDDADIDDEEALSFLNSAIQDPFAAQDILKFQRTLEKDGRSVPLSQIRSMMIISQAKAPVQDKMDYISQITGKDFTDEKEFYRVAQELSKITTTPGRTFTVTPKPGVLTSFEPQEKRQKAMADIVLQNTIPLAKAKVKEMLNDPSQATELSRIQGLLNQIQSGGDQSDRAAQFLMDEFMTPAEFQENLVEMFPSKFEGYQNNPYLPPQLRALNTEPESLPESQTLTQEDINNSPNLQRLNAQPGDKIINGVLHDANGNPKQ
jgi:hypothetical protein